MLKKILFSLGVITLTACSDSTKISTSNSELSETSVTHSNQEKITEKIDIKPKDPSIPNLNNFVDINSKDKKKSLVYWYIANTDHDMDTYDYIRVFSPKILVEQNSFERERMIEEFKANVYNYEKDVNYYTNLKYFSIPFDSSNTSIDENDISAEMLTIYEYDHQKAGFTNICVRDYSTGTFFSKREEISNTYIKFVDKTSRSDADSLCFLPLKDKNKAEEIYNLFRDGKTAILGKAYVKLSSIQDIENKNTEYNFDPSNTIFIETVALDIKILQQYDENDNYIKNISDMPVLHHAIIGSPKYFN
ncbi:hypothetical protein [Acinetobacter venetianus]|uniref:hypothetical protein n=1 Tax=Acinetobacter venetianus TaxID=52133 RepID=UPI00037214EF|nr:hypothetical protein [Acinetobacter venetianus]